MFDIDNVDRGIELFVFRQTFICTHLDPFENIVLKLINNINPDLKEELIEPFIEDNSYLDFIVKELECLKNADEK